MLHMAWWKELCKLTDLVVVDFFNFVYSFDCGFNALLDDLELFKLLLHFTALKVKLLVINLFLVILRLRHWKFVIIYERKIIILLNN